ncbi:MAG: hypothetical protein ACQESR_16890 [Planctomycetota bacterium]
MKAIDLNQCERLPKKEYTMTHTQANNRCLRQKAGQATMTCCRMCMALTMALTAFTQSANAADSKDSIWSGWNTYEPDTRALGYAYISTRDNSYNAPGESETDRIATYRVPFAHAGTYDLYVRSENATMVFSKVFGHDYQWQVVKNLKTAEGEYTWVNFSERFGLKQGDLTYTVDAPGTKVLGIASRNRGKRIDAFAFGLADKTYTDAQLSAAVVGKPGPGLIGFQAESAVSFGTEKLTEDGQRLRGKYEQMLAAASAEIEKQLPLIDPQKQKACQDALAAQKLQLVTYQVQHRSWRRGYLHKVTGLRSARERVEEAPGRVADAEMKLKNALAMDDGHEDKARAVEEARKRLEKPNKNVVKFRQKLARAEKRIVQARKNKPKLDKELKVEADALDQARTTAMQAVRKLKVDELLASDSLDEQLATYAVISSASPFRLARYAEQGPKQEQRIEQLLADKQLMIQMLVADGPDENKYGPALEIYQAIQKASGRAGEGLFQRLAMAVALEHAEAIKLSVPEADGDEPQYADPVQRYLSYEKAYRAGELDPGFEGLDTWSLRMVVNGDEPDKISAWGRQMLRNYRPDLVTMDDYDWRYVKSVNTEINYTSKFQKMGWDRPDLQKYQNILANGGICGRRAFFGRFILRAFGIPTTARSQPGHAALVHWTPHGWASCLGGGWGAGHKAIFNHYPTDLDFLASTQARENPQRFMKVKRAQWIGKAQGEGMQYGYHDNVRLRHMRKYVKQSVDEIDVPGFWNTVACIKQNMIIADLKAKARDAVGEDLGESSEPELKDAVAQVDIPDTERKITVDDKGVIHVPAAASSNPTNNTDVIRFMASNLGGMQLHYTRFGGADTFEYTIDAPKAGTYQLAARLVTPAPKQHLFLKLNDATDRIDINLPHTIGMWDKLKPVEIELKKGKNMMTFYRGHYFQRGVTIRDFTLTPVK